MNPVSVNVTSHMSVPLTVILDGLFNDGFSVVDKCQFRQVLYIAKNGRVKCVNVPDYLYLVDALVYRVASIIHDAHKDIKKDLLVSELVYDAYISTVRNLHNKEAPIGVRTFIRQISHYIKDESLPIELRFKLCFMDKHFEISCQGEKKVSFVNKELCSMCMDIRKKYVEAKGLTKS